MNLPWYSRHFCLDFFSAMVNPSFCSTLHTVAPETFVPAAVQPCRPFVGETFNEQPGCKASTYELHNLQKLESDLLPWDKQSHSEKRNGLGT